MAEKLLYLGLDLGPFYTQLSYYNIEAGEPVSVCTEDSKGTFLLPNMLHITLTGDEEFKTNEDLLNLGDWSTGNSASAKRFKEDGLFVDQIYENVLEGKDIEVAEYELPAKALLTKMMELHITQFTSRFEKSVIKKLVVSLADADERIIKAVRGLQKALGLKDDEIEIVSNLDSAIYYVFNQPESLRNGSVAIFDFDSQGMEYYRIDTVRKSSINEVSVVHRDFKEKFNLDAFKDNLDALDIEFGQLVAELMKEKSISAVFLTGVGFSDNWMRISAPILCQGRRVFVGQNIYTKGACFRAVGGRHSDFTHKYFVNTEYTVHYDVGITLMDDKDTFYPITTGGGEWFNIRGKIYLILNHINRIVLCYKNSITGELQKENIEIHGLPKRPDKTTRLSLEVEFFDGESGAVLIRDEGFGTLFPTTNKIYRKEFSLNNDEEVYENTDSEMLEKNTEIVAEQKKEAEIIPETKPEIKLFGKPFAEPEIEIFDDEDSNIETEEE